MHNISNGPNNQARMYPTNQNHKKVCSAHIVAGRLDQIWPKRERKVTHKARNRVMVWGVRAMGRAVNRGKSIEVLTRFG